MVSQQPSNINKRIQCTKFEPNNIYKKKLLQKKGDGDQAHKKHEIFFDLETILK